VDLEQLGRIKLSDDRKSKEVMGKRYDATINVLNLYTMTGLRESESISMKKRLFKLSFYPV